MYPCGVGESRRIPISVVTLQIHVHINVSEFQADLMERSTSTTPSVLPTTTSVICHTFWPLDVQEGMVCGKAIMRG